MEFLLESADIISVLRREVTNSREVMQNEFKGFFLEYMNLLEDAIRRGIDQGIFRPVDPNVNVTRPDDDAPGVIRHGVFERDQTSVQQRYGCCHSGCVFPGY